MNPLPDPRRSSPTGRAPRRRALAVLVPLALLVLPPSLASATDLRPGARVYREDFEGELGFPTSPEVDTLGIGGLSGASGQDLIGPPPSLTGTSVVEVVSPNTTDLEATLVLADELGTDSFLLHGEFWGLVLPSEMSALVSLAASFPFLPPKTDYPGLNLWLTISDIDPPNPATGSLALVETDGDFTNGVLDNVVEVPLTSTQSAALRSGADFVLDLHVDRASGVLGGTLEIDGAPGRGVGPLTLAFTDPGDIVAFVTQGLTLLESDNLPTVPAVVRMDAYEIYQGNPILVPTLSPGAAGLLVALLGAAPWAWNRWRGDAVPSAPSPGSSAG